MKQNTPPKMPIRETRYLIDALSEIKRVATMETADFYVFDPDRKTKNAELKERTRLWRESYIIRPLAELIERYENALARQDGRTTTDRQLVHEFLASDGIPVNPKLPVNWDNTPHEDRPQCHQLLWGKPYIITQEEIPGLHTESWFQHWPSGTRYDVRCLDGGAWDRSTSRGQFATLEEAINRANELS